MRKKFENKELPFWIFYNPDPFGGDIYVEEFGYGVCVPGYVFSETRKNYLLQIVFDGIAHVSVNREKPFSVKKEEAFILPPHLEHWYRSDEQYPTARAWISWSGECADLLKQQLDSEKNPYLVKTHNLEEIKTLFLKLQNSRDRSAISVAAIYSCFYGIIANCMRTATAMPKIESQEKLLVNDIVNYIDVNIMNPLSVEDISKKFGYDASSVFRKFKKQTGLSPKEYILHRRLALAKGYICETDLGIEEIAARCGYSSAATLNILFIRHEKISLVNYVKKQRS